MTICSRFIVKGQVQMVGFRYHTAHEGLKLGLTGYAKNLNDSSVEVVACGSESSVAKLEKWLATGPRTASVSSVVGEPIPFKHYSDFRIL